MVLFWYFLEVNGGESLSHFLWTKENLWSFYFLLMVLFGPLMILFIDMVFFIVHFIVIFMVLSSVLFIVLLWHLLWSFYVPFYWYGSKWWESLSDFLCIKEKLWSLLFPFHGPFCGLLMILFIDMVLFIVILMVLSMVIL